MSSDAQRRGTIIRKHRRAQVKGLRRRISLRQQKGGEAVRKGEFAG